MLCCDADLSLDTSTAPPVPVAPATIGTPWSRGRLDGCNASAELLFGWMHEDWRIEAQAFPPESRVFAIASAGCTALALADCGHDVTAVDINPEQIRYCRERLSGGETQPGAIDRLLALGRRLLPAAGITRARLREFLALRDTRAQLAYWRERLHTHRWRALIACAFSPLILRSVYAAPLLSALPPRFPEVLHARLERLWSLHPNRDNPFAWRLWLGRSLVPSRVAEKRRTRPSFECADAAEFLECAPPGSFDAFTFSNIIDGAAPAYAERLWKAVRRAASPDAVVVIRSIGLPRTPDEDHWAARDRSGLWGDISVTHLTAGVRA